MVGGISKEPFLDVKKEIYIFGKTQKISIYKTESQFTPQIQKTSSRPSIRIPNIFSLYLSETGNYVAIINTINLDPELEDSTLFYHLENQIIN